MATRWQLFSTHIHTNNTGNVTKQTIHRTTQKIHRTTQQLGRVRAMSRLCGFYPGICLTTEHCCVIFFVYESTDYTKLVRAMAQGFSRWSHSREAMVRTQVGVRCVLDKVALKQVFFSEHLGCPSSQLSTSYPFIYHRRYTCIIQAAG